MMGRAREFFATRSFSLYRRRRYKLLLTLSAVMVVDNGPLHFYVTELYNNELIMQNKSVKEQNTIE